MNIGALMQEVYDVKQRGLDHHLIRLHRFGRNRVYGGSAAVSFGSMQFQTARATNGLRQEPL
jgi:hypothetical protein